MNDYLILLKDGSDPRDPWEACTAKDYLSPIDALREELTPDQLEHKNFAVYRLSDPDPITKKDLLHDGIFDKVQKGA